MSVVVVIPAFEGERTIGGVVAGARAAGHPVIVVDDGSRDRTADAAAEAGATVLRHPQNHGKGAALQTGFAHATRAGALGVATLDADGQHDPAELPSLITAHRERPDALVMGVRSFAPEAMPRRNSTGNRISTYWISLYARRPHRDTQSGFRVYPRALFAGTRLRSRRFETETELLLLAARRRVPLVEVPIKTIYEKGANGQSSHFHGFRDTLSIMRLVFFSPLWPREEPLDP